ncbi:MAG: hypothetical protein ACOC4M_11920 [Promethearchaeia archaeon]
MQIFQPIILEKYPYMKTKAVTEGNTVKEILESPENQDQVYLLVDHDKKRILTYNGARSSFKLQIYGGILAHKLRIQLRGFYRVFPLSGHPKDSKLFTEILEKPLGGGRAEEITESDFTEQHELEQKRGMLSVHQGLRVNKALEYINKLPKPQDLRRECILIGANIFVDEKKAKALITEEKDEESLKKMGKLNSGFTFFGERTYSTRLIVKNKKVQGIELFVPENKESQEILNLKVPVIYDEKISQSQDINVLVNAFNIPEEYPGGDEQNYNEPEDQSSPS